jgi:hypothetical protein
MVLAVDIDMTDMWHCKVNKQVTVPDVALLLLEKRICFIF